MIKVNIEKRFTLKGYIKSYVLMNNDKKYRKKYGNVITDAFRHF